MKRERGLVRPVACAAAVLRRFVYGPGIDQPVRMDVATAPGGPSFTKYYYHLDGLGNVIALSNAAGTVVEQYAYDAYGLPSTTSAVGNPYLFNARCYDSETGLYYYRARYYDPRIGRFLQPDPVGYGPALNLYAYCRDNPLNLLDPHGLWSLLKWLYAGDGNASDAEYQAAVDTAAQWLLGTSPVRGGYVGVRKGWKPKGTSVGRAVGTVGSWTMDEGFGVDVGGGLGVRGRTRTPLGTVPGSGLPGPVYQSGYLGGALGFGWHEESGWGATGAVGGTLGTKGPTYTGAGAASLNLVGGTVNLGIQYGPLQGGLILDPDRFDSTFFRDLADSIGLGGLGGGAGGTSAGGK